VENKYVGFSSCRVLLSQDMVRMK